MYHKDAKSMMRESLREMIEVARYCVEFDKTVTWGYQGCYGFPGALLLLCIVDAIGKEILGGGDDIKKHFEIFNHKDYYDLDLNVYVIELLRNEYRNRLSHNALIGENVAMFPGDKNSPIIEDWGGKLRLNLVPFLIVSERVVNDFLNTLS